MMRSRKPLAVLTAIATMIGGLAIGGIAQADTTADPNNTATWAKTITLKASDYMQQFYTTTYDANASDLKANLRSFKYVKLASYETSESNGANGAKEYRLTLNTVADNTEKIKTAFNNVTLADNSTLGSKYQAQVSNGITDPLRWLGTQNLTEGTSNNNSADGKLTITAANQYDLAAQLETQFNNTADEITTADIAVNKADKTLTFTFSDPGLYLIIDETTGNGVVNITSTGANGSTGTRTYGKIKPILIGTPIPTDFSITNPDDAAVKLGRVDSTEIKQTISDEIKTKVFFKKTDAQGNALQGATFTIRKVKTDKVASVNPADKDSFDQVWNQSDNFDSSFGTNGSADASSDQDGKFDFDGLSKGKYLIYETGLPTGGYLEDYAGRFILEVQQNDAPNNGTAAPTISHTLTDVLKSGLLTDADDNGLVSTGKTNNGTSDANPYTYKNITDTSQLPATGGTGIALFIVAAVILAGGAGVLAVKSRKTKRMLTM
ncbi:LPXTG cell wall anchor domain-containing protein [Bifidobacterium sp. 82T10]|uniref:LPXTG cell wall anchor domain-containing protein n=1 Tax=Bifidobacterium miconis TaxID=2834435 RepID=A0ABS6WDI9_9BIFI|nr:SpaA isopeptide-forming pilin-related protein [Bifidobacterium miconis]MBW3092012.1 LPXTG cell wall anchor domain-containing protein [Bifidobacterium miconis]